MVIFCLECCPVGKPKELCSVEPLIQGLVKGAILCFRNLDFYFRHGESTSTASQKSKNLNKVPLLLQDLALIPLSHSSLVLTLNLIPEAFQNRFVDNSG